jgi:sodium-dependent dicarboxylate transporter 2/3/5
VKNRIPLLIGPAALVATLVLPPPPEMPVEAWRVAGVAAWMATWWLTAVIPLEATALLPIALLPAVAGASIDQATAPYADPIIFLFLGGFLLGATLERWDLHRRFALATVRVAGTSGPRVILAFMGASAALSMWISNTATAVMMLPIAKAVAGDADDGSGRTAQSGTARHGFQTALLLGVAYGCSIGGVSTLIGTPPNAIFAGAARELLGEQIGFGRWLGIGLPISIPMFFIAWYLLVRIFRVRGEVEGLGEVVTEQSRHIGKLSGAERYIMAVFTVTALAWVARAPKTIGTLRIPGVTDLIPGLSDTGIAIAAALVLFVIPLKGSRFPTALDWRTASRVPWGILLLFGGGLTLAASFADSGLTVWVGGRLQALSGAPLPLVLLVTVVLFVLLTELTSNSATTALGMPLIVGAAQGLGVDALPLMIGATLAASMAFMLPVATPPNAIVFGSGLLRGPDMARAGAPLNVAAAVVITLIVWVLVL